MWRRAFRLVFVRVSC